MGRREWVAAGALLLGVGGCAARHCRQPDGSAGDLSDAGKQRVLVLLFYIAFVGAPLLARSVSSASRTASSGTNRTL